MLQATDPIVWVFTGDSITLGARHTYGHRSYSEHVAERLRYELLRRRDIVINTAISGDRAADLAKDMEHRVFRFRPQVFSLMLGMNDAEAGPAGREPFRLHYDNILRAVREKTDAVLIVHTCNPITAAATDRADLPAYVNIIRELAGKHNAILVDHDKHWRERGTPIEYLLNDATIHPNQYGHVLLATLTCQSLGIHDPHSNVGRLFVP
jgi:lysophospholipase L1-like esterase